VEYFPHAQLPTRKYRQTILNHYKFMLNLNEEVLLLTKSSLKNDKPKGMDLKVFKLISLVGKHLALIPFSNENATPNCFPRLYPLLVFLLYMIGGIATFARTSPYANLSTMQFVLRVLLDLDLQI
jgi:hypothetical protein